MSETPGPLDVFVGNTNGRGLIRIETASNCAAGAGEHIASLARGPKFEAYAETLVRRFNAHDALEAALAAAQKRIAELEAEVARLPEALRRVAERTEAAARIAVATKSGWPEADDLDLDTIIADATREPT